MDKRPYAGQVTCQRIDRKNVFDRSSCQPDLRIDLHLGYLAECKLLDTDRNDPDLHDPDPIELVLFI